MIKRSDVLDLSFSLEMGDIEVFRVIGEIVLAEISEFGRVDNHEQSLVEGEA